MKEAENILGESVTYAKDVYDSVLDAEAIFHVTEWKEFRLPNWEVVKRSMKPNPVLFDGRNVFDKAMLDGIEYLKIG
jgi:UDPglucose 6-dehydrogenase